MPDDWRLSFTKTLYSEVRTVLKDILETVVLTFPGRTDTVLSS
jgi:hypothetical protein